MIARALLGALALMVLLAVPTAQAIVRDGSDRDAITGTNLRDLLRGGHGGDTRQGRA
jgi:hypothetical protein